MAQPIPTPPLGYNQPEMAFTLQVVEQRLQDLERAVSEQPYVVTGGTGIRTLDVTTATATDVADFLATLMADLKTAGRIA